jgi:hypothetical protein
MADGTEGLVMEPLDETGGVVCVAAVEDAAVHVADGLQMAFLMMMLVLMSMVIGSMWRWVEGLG